MRSVIKGVDACIYLVYSATVSWRFTITATYTAVEGSSQDNREGSLKVLHGKQTFWFSSCKYPVIAISNRHPGAHTALGCSRVWLNLHCFRLWKLWLKRWKFPSSNSARWSEVKVKKKTRRAFRSLIEFYRKWKHGDGIGEKSLNDIRFFIFRFLHCEKIMPEILWRK